MWLAGVIQKSLHGLVENDTAQVAFRFFPLNLQIGEQSGVFEATGNVVAEPADQGNGYSTADNDNGRAQ